MNDCQHVLGYEFVPAYSHMHSAGMKEIGDRLDELMQAHPLYRGRGQSALARDTGVPQPTIARILGNKSVPEMGTVVKLAEAFDVTCEWLLTGRGPKFIAELGGSTHSVSIPHHRKPAETDFQKLPNDVTEALQSVLTSLRKGIDIRNSDLRLIIWFALAPAESGTMARSPGPAPEHEQTIVERAAAAIKRAGNEHAEQIKGGAKKRH